MRYLLIAAMVLAFSFGAAMPSLAHPKNNALTTIYVKEKKLEITHRFFLHDVDVAAKQLSGGKQEVAIDASAQKQFGEYLAKKFTLRINDQPLSLAYIGHEIEGKYFWIYQEYDSPIDVHALEVRHDVLMDYFPKQQNLVNLERGAIVKSLIFSKGDSWKKISPK